MAIDLNAILGGKSLSLEDGVLKLTSTKGEEPSPEVSEVAAKGDTGSLKISEWLATGPEMKPYMTDDDFNKIVNFLMSHYDEYDLITVPNYSEEELRASLKTGYLEPDGKNAVYKIK